MPLVFDQHPGASIITSFPGLGPLTGSRELAEIGGDRSRFSSAGAMKAYAARYTRAGPAHHPTTRASGRVT
ncbi:transposase [Streptomyces formicae]